MGLFSFLSWYDGRMNAQEALWYVHSYIKARPEEGPAPQFRIGTAQQVSVTGESFFLVGLVDESGRAVKGGKMYYVFPDGMVITSSEDPSNPEHVEAIWLRWKSHSF